MTKKIMNDLVFKYVYGQDTKLSKEALKGLLHTFLDLKIEDVQIKNTNSPDANIVSKDVRFDISALLDNQTWIDVEMQMESMADSLQNRLEYYESKMLASQDMKGKYYQELKPCIVLIFLDVNLFDDDHMIKIFQNRSQYNTQFNPNNLMSIVTVEMNKLNSEVLEKMNVKEEYVYYLKNCHNAQNDSKIKEILQNVEAIRMADQRFKEITNDEWDALNREFDELKRNENEMREKYYQDLYRKEGIEKGIELGRKEGIKEGRAEGIVEGRAEGIVEGEIKGITKTIRNFSKVMSVEQIASVLDKSVDEINKILKD